MKIYETLENLIVVELTKQHKTPYINEDSLTWVVNRDLEQIARGIVTNYLKDTGEL